MRNATTRPEIAVSAATACVATSVATEEQARSLGMAVLNAAEVDRLDLAIDGADQIAPDWWIVKGGGAAHTREKVVASMADRFVVIADSSKVVDGLRAPIPLELLHFGLANTLRLLNDGQLAEEVVQETFLAALRAYPKLRDACNLRGWVLTIATRKAIDAQSMGSRFCGSCARRITA